MSSFGWAYILVPTAQRQPICVTYNRTTYQFHLEVQVPYHPSQHGQLCRVFLSEVRPIWTHHMKQLCYDSCDTGKVPWPRSSIQPISDTRYRNGGHCTLWIHLCCHRGE